MKQTFLKSVAFAAVLMAGTAFADPVSYYFKQGATDWASKDSFAMNAARTVPATSAPATGDVVELYKGTTYEIDSAGTSFPVFANLSKILMTEDAVLAVTVDSGTASASPIIRAGTEASVTDGTIVKKGGGTLVLATDPVTQISYPDNLDVQGGTLSIFPDHSAACDFFFGNIRVASGATLSLPWSKTGSSRSNFHSVNVAPGGRIINETTRASGHDAGFHFYSSSPRPASVISGTLEGNLRLWAESDILIDGTNATHRQVVASKGGVVSASTFAVGEDQPLGDVSTLWAYGDGGGFAFAGTEAETVTRDFEVSVGSKGFATLGSGAVGITYAGDWIPSGTGGIGAGVRRLVLTGSNQTEAVMSGDICDLTHDGTTYPFAISKKGSGVWRLDDSVSRFYPNVWRILDGTLRFDSLRAKGVPCSLGTSRVLTADSATAIDDGDYVPYSFLLGGEEGDPVLENVSTEPVAALGRTVALDGTGGRLRSSTAASWEMDGVSAVAAGNPTLTLDGTGSNPSNIVKNITDGANGAKVSVVKEGTGTWRIGGKLTFSGGLVVKDGTLKVESPQGNREQKPFEYYRLSFAQIGDGGASHDMQLRQICLFDANGNRLNGTLKALLGDKRQKGQHKVYVPKKIPAGYAGYDPSMEGHYVNTTHEEEFESCFNESGYQSPANEYGVTIQSKSGGACVMTPEDEDTWIRIVMHLPEGSAPVSYFDIQGVAGWAYLPTRLKLEGSCDGQHWTEVWGNVESGTPLSERATYTGYNKWLSDGTAASNASHARPPASTRWNVSATSGDWYKPFSWFRLSFAQLGEDGNTSNYVQIREICLFDRFGDRQNAFLKPLIDQATALPRNTHPAYMASSIGPGEVGYDRSVAGYKVKSCPSGDESTQEFGASFTNLFSTNDGVWDMEWMDASGVALTPTASDRSTWIPIVMHLADGAEPITHFDIQGFNVRAIRNHWPTRLMLEGSCDGIHWTTVHDNATKGAAYDYSNYGSGSGYGSDNNNLWLSDGGHCNEAGAACYQKRTLGDGSWTLTTSWEQPEGPYEQLGDATVQVSGGMLTATSPIEISSFRIDAAAAGGILENFVFADNGTLDIVGEKIPSGFVLPGSYLNCQGLANLSHWTLTFNGKATACTVAFKDGKLMFYRPGMTLIVR